MSPQMSLLISNISADKVLEVGEDRATTLVLGQELRVLHSEVEMVTLYITMEVQG